MFPEHDTPDVSSRCARHIFEKSGNKPFTFSGKDAKFQIDVLTNKNRPRTIVWSMAISQKKKKNNNTILLQRKIDFTTVLGKFPSQQIFPVTFQMFLILTLYTILIVQNTDLI